MVSVQCTSVKLLDETRPPWLVLLLGFFLIDGFFGAISVLLWMTQVDNLLYVVPPFSFMWWYAYEDPWGWILPFISFLEVLTPILELACAWSIWRTPEKTRRPVLIVGTAAGLTAVLRLLFDLSSPDWDVGLGYVTAMLADLALAVFVVWFVHRVRTLSRPAPALIAAYLILTGINGLVADVEGILFGGISNLRILFDARVSWFVILDGYAIIDAAGSASVVMCGILILRRRSPITAITIILVLANLSTFIMWVMRTNSSRQGPLLEAAYNQLFFVCPIIANLVLILALVRFMYRNIAIFRPVGLICRTCDYNLTGNLSGVCPECGMEIEQNAKEREACDA